MDHPLALQSMDMLTLSGCAVLAAEHRQSTQGHLTVRELRDAVAHAGGGIVLGAACFAGSIGVAVVGGTGIVLAALDVVGIAAGLAVVGSAGVAAVLAIVRSRSEERRVGKECL